jgi:hypothetical protein
MRSFLFVLVLLVGCSRNQPNTPNPAPAPADKDKGAISSKDGQEPKPQPVDTKIPLAEKQLLDGKVTMLIPKEFEVMSEEMLKVKYPSERRPTLVYTNEPGSVNIALNHTQNKVLGSQLPQAHKSVETTFKNLYPSATWFRSELSTINDRDFFLLDLRTPGIDTPIRNIIVGTSCQGRLLLVTCNMTEKLEAEWLPVCNKAIQSIRVSE